MKTTHLLFAAALALLSSQAAAVGTPDIQPLSPLASLSALPAQDGLVMNLERVIAARRAALDAAVPADSTDKAALQRRLSALQELDHFVHMTAQGLALAAGAESSAVALRFAPVMTQFEQDNAAAISALQARIRAD